MFFNRPDFDLASAESGSFRLVPPGDMLERLRRDYEAMSLMIYGKPPDFEEVLHSIAALEARPNAQSCSDHRFRGHWTLGIVANMEVAQGRSEKTWDARPMPLEVFAERNGMYFNEIQTPKPEFRDQAEQGT
jgi:hypothetical protein